MKAIKPFHELTEAEFNEICEEKMTWAECAEKYPQPKWCSYPDAVCVYYWKREENADK